MPETNRLEYKSQVTQNLDLEKEVVEQLGSGIPHILESYDKACFHFSENFLRMVLPASEKLTTQVRNLLEVFDGTHNRQELQDKLGLAIIENLLKAKTGFFVLFDTGIPKTGKIISRWAF